jgi:two-component system cell cycle response regulator
MCARVLVIDDDPVNAELLGYLLRAFGHEAILELGGEAALRDVRLLTPDLVLCDIQMPDMDGFEFLRLLRKDERFSRTPIVGVTALAMVGDREKILAAGFDGYLTKPITPETFVAQIEKYLPPRSVAPQKQPSMDALAAPHSNPTAKPQQRPGYVLVVDDVPANLELLRHLISSLSFEVRAASNTHDALRIARDAKPNLIVSDVHMPEPNGLALLKIVKSDAVLKDVPFLFVSSSVPTTEDKRRAHAYGVDGMLIRPLDPEIMLELFAKWLPGEQES